MPDTQGYYVGLDIAASHVAIAAVNHLADEHYVRHVYADRGDHISDEHRLDRLVQRVALATQSILGQIQLETGVAPMVACVGIEKPLTGGHAGSAQSRFLLAATMGALSRELSILAGIVPWWVESQEWKKEVIADGQAKKEKVQQWANITYYADRDEPFWNEHEADALGIAEYLRIRWRRLIGGPDAR